ncbi:hypothetical protein PSET11_01303 [Arthrobacter ulcerisalmonis]|uniref:Uncharacterized protein n=1 Tax=Arthrobacter ulcerisalmonis TaxID=2483813 RepID=A0A3P5WXU1_9MICC|nr:hypothetical protein [Arthrobacter ulcerisalmonis]VDC23861.1 hypothetical protein PSET11_01303 [Arthrobacter ulcerisalmonis]
MTQREQSVDDAASRASAFVYGNILTLAALIAVGPDPEPLEGLLYILGTGASTYVAHMLGELVGGRVRHREGVDVHDAVQEFRNARPIASSATIPALLLGMAALGWLEPQIAWIAAQIVTLVRLALLGIAVARWRGERSSLRLIFSGIGLAVGVALVSALKYLLTH